MCQSREKLIAIIINLIKKVEICQLSTYVIPYTKNLANDQIHCEPNIRSSGMK